MGGAILTPRRLRQLWYVPLLSLSMGLLLVRLLVMARLLSVPAFATFSGGLLASSTFCMLACLGLQSVLQRDWPVMLVHRRERAGLVLVMQCLLVAVACALVGLGVTLLGAGAAGLAPELVAVGLVHGLSQQVFLLATVESRSRGLPLLFAGQNLARGALVLGGGASTAWLTGSPLLVLAVEAGVSFALTAQALAAAAVRARWPLSRACRLGVRRMTALPWASAAALLAVTVVGFALLNVDRWLAAHWLAPAQFAAYAFAWTLLMIAQSLQTVVNASVYPLLARRCAAEGRARAFSICTRASLALLLAGAALALPCWWIADEVVVRLYPQYDTARPLLALFMAIAVLRLSDFWSSFLIITGHERRLLASQLVVGAAVGAAWYWRHAGGRTPDGSDVALLAAALTAGAYVASTVLAHVAAARTEP